MVLLGAALGLDSFRASLGLGVGRGGLGWRLRTASAFGVCDWRAPVLGLMLGATLVTSLSPWGGVVGSLALVGFGLFTFLLAVGMALEIV
jgi:putative Mn2+ efflux pump MntP